MGPGDEADVLAAALATIGRDVDEVLAVQKGRRQVVRAGDVVVKAFASVEQAAFERERAGLRALAGTGVAVELVADGERWTATRHVPGTTVPMHLGVDEGAIHRALGPWLASLHAIAPTGLAPWSVVDRLRARLADPPPGCPPALAADVGRLVEPWLGLIVDDAFVHGDWGTANVLVRPDAPTEVVAVIDLEDAHRGDPAEDFAWPVLAGPDGPPQQAAMASTYGRPLGPHAVERLVVCGAEKCLDVLGWTLSGDQGARFNDRCRQTLEELVAGVRPPAP
jgi:aminoglycoside phosphotransferase (APT) family kinase protein